MSSDPAPKSKTDSLGDESPSTPSQPSSVFELGRYRAFLRMKAARISPHYRGRIEASDIVQQTLMEAHKKIGQFRGGSEPEMAKWLGQMLKNNIADAIRALRRKKRDIFRERPLESGTPSSASPADWIASDQTTPSLQASNAEQLLKLSDAISKLPPAQQVVVILHHIQGKTLSEVAEHLDRTTSSVAGLLYRGLKRLREILDQQ